MEETTKKKDLCSISAELAGISAEIIMMYNLIDAGSDCSQLTDRTKMSFLFSVTEHLDRIVQDLDEIDHSLPAEVLA